MTTTMSIKPTIKGNRTYGNYGTSYVMFGQVQETDKWFERYFDSIEKAKAYASKKNWTIKKITERL